MPWVQDSQLLCTPFHGWHRAINLCQLLLSVLVVINRMVITVLTLDYRPSTVLLVNSERIVLSFPAPTSTTIFRMEVGGFSMLLSIVVHAISYKI